MSPDPTEFGAACLPDSVAILGYCFRMGPKDTKKALWENVLALMERDYLKENLTRLARDADIGGATAKRIKDARTSVGVDVIERIAKVFDVRPWQLLTPGLGADLYVIDEERRVVPVLKDKPRRPGLTLAASAPAQRHDDPPATVKHRKGVTNSRKGVKNERNKDQ